MSDYSQNDQRWRNTILGFNTGVTDTIGNYGCYVTAIADVCKWAGNDMTPVQINDICKQNSWFANGGLISRDDIPAQLCNNLTFAGRTNWNDAVSMNFFADASDPNVSYIICIDASKAPGVQTHFVMVWNTLGAGDLEIEDSWDGLRKSLSSYGNPSVIIQSACKFTKNPVSPSTVPLYTVESVSPRLIQLTKSSSLWNLILPSTIAIDNSPIQEYPQGYQETVSAIAHRMDGTNYYLVLPDSTSGFNVLDCEDYVPIPSPSPPSPITITAPVTASSTKQYSLVREVPSYPSPGNAVNRTNSNGKLANGAYYIFNRQQGMYSLTKTLGQSQGTWVNPADNVLNPPTMSAPVKTNDTTADVQGSWRWFFSTHEAVEYKVLRDLLVKDIIHGGPPIQIHAGRTIDIYGSFEKDGKTYLRPFTQSDLNNRYYFYGIPTTDIYSGAPYLDNEFDVMDTISAKWESFYDKMAHPVKTIEGIFKPKKRR